MQRSVFVVCVLFGLSGCVSAWGDATYEAAARRLCLEFDCGCLSSVVEGSTAPDLRFKDTPTHHCYKPELDYTQYTLGQWSKPLIDDCPALDKAASWLRRAEADMGCRRWYDFGVALHYFLDYKEFWNNVVDVNRSCVVEQEGEVDDYMLFGGGDWRSCSCGICVSADDFNNWLIEYRERIKHLVYAKKPAAPSVVILSNSLDLEASRRLGGYLESLNVTVTYASASSFTRDKNAALVVVAGGQNAPEVGSIVSSVLTDSDKAAVMGAAFTAAVIKKRDVWVGGQTVYFVAGWGVNETADGLWASRETLLAEVLASVGAGGGCSSNLDCGTPYWGPYVCTTRREASRVMYTPVCVGGLCRLRSGRPSVDGCGVGEVCVSPVGCVPASKLTVSDGVRRLMFHTWVTADVAASTVGRNASAVVYVRTYLNESMRCQYYGPGSGGWADLGVFSASANGTLQRRVVFSSNVTGRFVFPVRVRCGNISGDASSSEFTTLFYAEHNVTFNIAPPPIAFTFTVKPDVLVLSDCFGGGNVSLRIENLCGHRIRCVYYVGGVGGAVELPHAGESYNVTGGYWTWRLRNVTYEYMDYYSGSDMLNGSYTLEGEDGGVVVVNISQDDVDVYADQPKNITVYYPTIFKDTSNATYIWDIPHWFSDTVWVDSDECTVDRVSAYVSCTDRYSQYSTLRREIKLKYPLP